MALAGRSAMHTVRVCAPARSSMIVMADTQIDTRDPEGGLETPSAKYRRILSFLSVGWDISAGAGCERVPLDQVMASAWSSLRLAESEETARTQGIAALRSPKADKVVLTGGGRSQTLYDLASGDSDAIVLRRLGLPDIEVRLDNEFRIDLDKFRLVGGRLDHADAKGRWRIVAWPDNSDIALLREVGVRQIGPLQAVAEAWPLRVLFSLARP